jgi:hypothetical protein
VSNIRTLGRHSAMYDAIFLGTWAGTVPVPEFFAPENMQRIMGAR